MHHIGKTQETISFYSDLSKDRIFIRAIFTDVAEANKYMGENPDQGLYAEFGPFLLIASMPGRSARQTQLPVNYSGVCCLNGKCGGCSACMADGRIGIEAL